MILTTVRNRLRGNLLPCGKVRHFENNFILRRSTRSRDVAVRHKNYLSLWRARRGDLSPTTRRIHHSRPRNISLPPSQVSIRTQTGIEGMECHLRQFPQKIRITPKRCRSLPIFTPSRRRVFVRGHLGGRRPCRQQQQLINRYINNNSSTVYSHRSTTGGLSNQAFAQSPFFHLERNDGYHYSSF